MRGGGGGGGAFWNFRMHGGGGNFNATRGRGTDIFWNYPISKQNKLFGNENKANDQTQNYPR